MKKQKLDKKLAAYSAAAAAALMMAPASANAVVVYSGVQNLPVNTSTSAFVDMALDGGTDFSFHGTDTDTSWMYLSIASGSQFIDYYSNADPARLPYGYVIQNTLANTTTYNWDAEGSDTLASSGGDGNFNGATGYIGVRFPSSCGVTYGWIQFQGINPSEGTVIDWAYESCCGTIDAGATTGGTTCVNSVVPTMGEWGMLALAGLLSAAAISAINREKEETA